MSWPTSLLRLRLSHARSEWRSGERPFSPATNKLQAFLDFVLGQYVRQGVEELDQEKLSALLSLKYHSVNDAASELGGVLPASVTHSSDFARTAQIAGSRPLSLHALLIPLRHTFLDLAAYHPASACFRKTIDGISFCEEGGRVRWLG